MVNNISLLKLAAFSVLLFVFISCGSSRKAGRAKVDKEKENVNDNSSGGAKKKQLVAKYENLVGTKLDPDKSYPLYAFIDGWMGTPHCDGGSTKKCTDCSGFVCNLYKDVYKIVLPRSSEDQFKKAGRVKLKQLQEGQLVFFTIEKKNKISHVGVYLANNKFVHVSSKKGVRIDDLNDPYFVKTFKGGGRIGN